MALENRYEFMFYIECVNGNPNGDPDMGNTPRIDPEDMHGYITDVAIKRRIRNYIQTAFREEDETARPGMEIIMQNATNINRFIARVREGKGIPPSAKEKEPVYKARQSACELFFDVRTFGAVLSTGPNAGQVRGPVQLTFAKSIDAVLPQDISITRMLVADTLPDKIEQSYENYDKKEKATPEDKLRTMGRKQFIPYGLYEARGFISANLANETGFDAEDLRALFEAILNMYEHDRSASKGQMSVISPLIIFRHDGTDSDIVQKKRQSMLGCAPAHKLFDTVTVKRRSDIAYPRSYTDYDASIALSKLPAGVTAGFLSDPYGEISWNALPNGCDWLTAE